MKAVLNFARESGVANVNGTHIEMPAPTDEASYARNKAFWQEVFGQLYDAKTAKLTSCEFLYRTATPIPLTRFERLKQRFGIEVKQREEVSPVKKAAVTDVRFVGSNEHVRKDGLVNLCVSEKRAEKEIPPDFPRSVLWLPIEHRVLITLDAGQIQRIAF